VFQVPGGVINQGFSEVSFSFTLPTGIPSSFYYKDKKCREKPKAKVKYTVGCELEIPGENLKTKQVLIIREPPVAFKPGEVQQDFTSENVLLHRQRHLVHDVHFRKKRFPS
jgi:hypothetical protein